MSIVENGESKPFRKVDHVGYVVSNLEEAASFFVDVLKFPPLDRTGRLEDAEGDLMTARFGVDARAVGRYAFFDGGSIAIELLEWTAPHRNGDAPINSDQGGRHLALRVDNMAAALERLAASPGVAIRQPNDAGFIYVRTPFGLEIQLLPSS